MTLLIACVPSATDDVTCLNLHPKQQVDIMLPQAELMYKAAPNVYEPRSATSTQGPTPTTSRRLLRKRDSARNGIKTASREGVPETRRGPSQHHPNTPNQALSNVITT